MRSGLASTITLGHRRYRDGLHCTQQSWRGGSTAGVIVAQQAAEGRCAGVVVVVVGRPGYLFGRARTAEEAATAGRVAWDVVGTHQRCPAGFGITRWQGHAGKNDVSVIPAPRGGVSTRRPPARRSQTGRRSRSAYVYVMPFVVLFGIFGLYPMVYSVVLSFENYSPGQPATWAGLANFTRALNDPTVWLAFRNVLLLLGVRSAVPIGVRLPYSLIYARQDTSTNRVA